MKARRDLFLTVGLLLILVLIVVGIGLFQSRQDLVPPLSSSSNTPDGARALRLWMEALDHSVSIQAGESFSIPPNVQVVFILEPLSLYPITTDEWKSIEDWVSGGGVLFLASQNISAVVTGSSIDFKMIQTLRGPVDFSPAAPLLRYPPLRTPVTMRSWALFEGGEEGQISLLSSDKGSAAIEVELGQGKMILVGDTSFLTNAGLKDPISAALALNLFSSLPPGGSIWFDEWHHGERTVGVTASGPQAWLQNTPAGRAVLFSAAVIFIALLLAGRRFGRPVPLPNEQARRAPIEHVTALANLNRRAGHRGALMRDYRASLKRAFGRRYRLDPELPDEQYVARLASYNPKLDSTALLNLLKRLNRRKFTEAQMVQLAREAAEWMKQVEH